MAKEPVIDVSPASPRRWLRSVLGKGLIALFLLLLIIPLAPWGVVPPGHRGVLVQLGAVRPGVLGEGLHFRLPLVQHIVLVDVRVAKAQTEADAASRDLQSIMATIAVNYHPEPSAVDKLYQRVGLDYKERLIDPAVQESVKAATARYTAEELITRRQAVSSEIRDLLEKRLRQYDIRVDEFSVVNFQFSEEFNRAIEAKQTAEQLALKAQRDLERVRVEAEQKLAQARAEAEALRIQKENVTPELVRLREIEAQLRAIEKWDGKLPQVTGGAVPFLGTLQPRQ